MAHIGVLKVLQREGIRPDLIVGTSMGAVIGGMYSQLDDIVEVEKRVKDYIDSFGVQGRWLNFLSRPEVKNHRDLFGDIANFIKKQYIGIRTLTSVSLEEKDILYEPLCAFFNDDLIENCRIPFAAVALDLRYGKTEVMTKGPIIDAIYASSAVEGAFPPIELRGLLLSDGGPIALVPVEIARRLGAKKVIAVDVSPGLKVEEECSSGLEIILRADTIAQGRIREFDLSQADLVISPTIRGVHWANFSRVNFCVKKGEIAALAAIDEIMRILAPRPWWRRIIPKKGE